MLIRFVTLLVASMFVAAEASAQATSVFKSASPSVFTVQAGRSVGTAFVVGGGRYLVTAFHVTDGSNNVVVGGGRIAVDGVHRFDIKRDICIYRLRLTHRSLQLLSQIPATGSKIYVVGTPLGFLENTISEGIVSGVRQADLSKMLQVTAPISPGSSGSPVLDSKGNAVAMIVGSIEEGQALNFAVPAPEIRSLLSGGSSGVTPSASTKPKTPSIAQLISIAKDEIWKDDDVIRWVFSSEEDVLAEVWMNHRYQYPELVAYAEKRVDELIGRVGNPEARRKLGMLGVIAEPKLRALVEREASANLVHAFGEALLGMSPSPSQRTSYLLLRQLASTGSNDVRVAALRPLAIADWRFIMGRDKIGFSDDEWRSWDPPPEALNAVLKILNDSDANVRRQAVYWLPTTEASHAPLSARLSNDPDYLVRASAAFMLGLIGDDSALVPLRNALTDKESYVRENVVEALARLDTPNVMPLIEQMLFDADSGVRHEATAALRDKKQRSSLGPLKVALQRETVDYLRDFMSDVIKEIEGKHTSRDPGNTLIVIIGCSTKMARHHMFFHQAICQLDVFEYRPIA